MRQTQKLPDEPSDPPSGAIKKKPPPPSVNALTVPSVTSASGDEVRRSDTCYPDVQLSDAKHSSSFLSSLDTSFASQSLPLRDAEPNLIKSMKR
ncbi:hypothetical protein GEMRC1_005184 [Eukaryota sp. GEM-RC1]